MICYRDGEVYAMTVPSLFPAGFGNREGVLVVEKVLSQGFEHGMGPYANTYTYIHGSYRTHLHHAYVTHTHASPSHTLPYMQARRSKPPLGITG
ncbi:hypothetical protein EON63_18175 [archaeon]|nr:MAG: hypothetical protein EON63_18175 [archaeon]